MRIPVPARALAALAASLVLGGCPRTPAPPPPPPPAVLVPPLHDAQPGEELRLRRGQEEHVWTIVSATDGEVEVSYRTAGAAGNRRDPPLRWSRNGFGLPEDLLIREFRRDRIEAGGRSWDCWLVRAHARDRAMWYWISDEAPVHGVIRMALDDAGKPVLASALEIVPEASSFAK